MPSVRTRCVPLVIITFALVTVAVPATAQDLIVVHGVVLSPAGAPVVGASVQAGASAPVITDTDGRFRLELAPGSADLRITHPTYSPRSWRITVDGTELLLQFEAAAMSDSVVVIGIRAAADAPVTQTSLDRADLDALAYGQDVPALLQSTPSLTWTSDSGIGANYSYFSLRGIQQTRINMTFDGAPLNDPAENAVYFNNLHDLVSEVDSVQIQRGVGTSSVGSPSYGGSVNFASRTAATRAGADVRLDIGTYATRRASIGAQSGRLGSGFSIGGRLALASTDGYRESSGSDHRTVFLNGGWEGDRSSLRLTALSGNERSQLAFLAVEPQVLEANRRFNPLDDAERDDFTQTLAQLRYTRAFGDATLLTASLYYNGADGWFQLWDDPVAQDQLQRFGVDQGFWGSMLTVSHQVGGVDLTGGVHVNDFRGDHSLDVASSRAYTNTGFKTTVNAFAKAEARFDRWLLFGDLQLRFAKFSYDGATDLGAVDWTFLDPRVGARWFASPQLSLYASAGRAQREPTRLDLLAGEDDATVPHDLRAVRPESVFDVEAGLSYATPHLSLQANVYAMEFRDEIALTGELSDIGLPLRRNVDASYRRGIEVDLRWRASDHWSLLHSLSLSHNRIQEWTQVYDVYDADSTWIGSEAIEYRDVAPLLSPEAVANLGIEWSQGAAAIALTGRYVGVAQLDNTGLRQFGLDDWATLDARAAFDLGHLWPGGRPRLDLFVNNLLDSTAPYPSGYSYQYLLRGADGSEALDGLSYYYPLATRNVVLQLALGF